MSFMMLRPILISIVVAVAVWVMQEPMIDRSEYRENEMRTMDYNLLPISSPRLTGWSLRILAQLIQTPIVGSILLNHLKRKNRVQSVRSFAATLGPNYMPLFYPFSSSPVNLIEDETKSSINKLLQNITSTSARMKSHGRHWTINDYTRRYQEKSLTPSQVVEVLIETIQEQMRHPQTSINAVVSLDVKDLRHQARESTERYANGNIRGILDGIPILVKDEVDVKGYASSIGTSFLAKKGGKAPEDALIIARLRQQGALLVGKSNMHEIGMGTTGYNAHFGRARNPYALHRYTGGSSSGSAAAVAAGLVPLAIGTDGGGSIRIPSALCGVVGLKATYQRIPIQPSLASSLAHIGPISGSITDAAIGFAVMSDEPANFHRWNDIQDLSDIRIGVYRNHVRDASPAVQEATETAIEHYSSLGANIVEVGLPNLREVHMAHSITILSEMVTDMDQYYAEHLQDFSFETQISTILGRSLTSRDFLSAQRIRSYAMQYIEELFKTDIDILLSPATGITAPEAFDDAEVVGESNLKLTAELMKYIIHGNFVGIPGIVFPIAYEALEDCRLPISIQLQAAHEREDVLFRVARAGEEGLLRDGWILPPHYVDILGETK